MLKAAKSKYLYHPKRLDTNLPTLSCLFKVLTLRYSSARLHQINILICIDPESLFPVDFPKNPQSLRVVFVDFPSDLLEYLQNHFAVSFPVASRQAFWWWLQGECDGFGGLGWMVAGIYRGGSIEPWQVAQLRSRIIVIANRRYLSASAIGIGCWA